jgi:hypothetical protein
MSASKAPQFLIQFPAHRQGAADHGRRFVEGSPAFANGLELLQGQPAAVETLQLKPVAVADLLERVFPAGHVERRDFRGDQGVAPGLSNVLDEPRNRTRLGIAMGVEKQ